MNACAVIDRDLSSLLMKQDTMEMFTFLHQPTQILPIE